MSGSDWESILDVREWSGGPPECPGVGGKPSRMFGRPFWMSGSGRVALLDVWQL